MFSVEPFVIAYSPIIFTCLLQLDMKAPVIVFSLKPVQTCPGAL